MSSPLNVSLKLTVTALDGSSYTSNEQIWSNCLVEGLLAIQVGVAQLFIDLTKARPAIMAAAGTGQVPALGDGYPAGTVVAPK